MKLNYFILLQQMSGFKVEDKDKKEEEFIMNTLIFFIQKNKSVSKWEFWRQGSQRGY